MALTEVVGQSVNVHTETKRAKVAQNTQIRIRRTGVGVEMLCLLILQLDNFSSGKVKHYPRPTIFLRSGPFKAKVTETVTGRSAGVAIRLCITCRLQNTQIR